MKVDAFDFELPPELVAQDAVGRGESRLLALNRNSDKLSHASVRELPSFLRAGDLLVANDTRVFPARLLGHRVPSGGSVECLLLHPDAADGVHRTSDIGHRTSDLGRPISASTSISSRRRSRASTQFSTVS